MYLHENTSVICSDVKKEAYLHAITADNDADTHALISKHLSESHSRK